MRTKIIYPFLLGHGFSSSDVKVEFAFSIRRGRQLQNRPRTDALVSKNGRAIFVIECKREDYELTASDQEQAVSYARLVQPEMPPYAILTNGRNTIILDTVLGSRVEGEIPIRDGVVASPSAIEQAIRLRHLANKHLLCLSADSLRSFIMKDLEEQIQIHSKGSLWPPYSPTAHIARPEIWNKIENFCNDDDDNSPRVMPLIGPATIGKTSEIFACIQQRLLSPESKTIPLYIPLNLAGPDFLPFLAETFEWAFNQSMTITSFIHDVDEIAISQGKTSVVYILDGADMTADRLTELRRQILTFIRRSNNLKCRHKVIVAAQKATWLRLVSGQSTDLGAYCKDPAYINSLNPEQSLRHIRALESLYDIQMAHSDNLPGLPAITHMLAQQIQTASDPYMNISNVLGRYFRWQISKVTNHSALLVNLTKLSARRLDQDADHLDLTDLSVCLDDAITAGFVVRTEDAHGREIYAFSDDWICYYIIGFHIWKLDLATPEALWSLIEQSADRVEYARALDWLSSVMVDHEIWRIVSQRRPSHYLHCYRLATGFISALSVGDDTCLWLAPYRGVVTSPWCSIIDGHSAEAHWGSDPELDLDKAPRNYEMRPVLSIFSRKPLVQVMVNDALNALKEIQRWMPDRRENYRCSERIWPAQHRVFERLRRRLNFRHYNLAEVARTLESPEYKGGVKTLQDILENAMRLTHSIAEVEFFGIRDLMPKRIRLEIGVGTDGRERMCEYYLESDVLDVEIALGRRGKVDQLSSVEQASADIRLDFGEMPLYRMLVAPYRMFPFPDPRLTWSQLKQKNGLRKINAVGNVAARWLASGISSALSGGLRKESIARERIISCLKNEGVSARGSTPLVPRASRVPGPISLAARSSAVSIASSPGSSARGRPPFMRIGIGTTAAPNPCFTAAATQAGSRSSDTATSSVRAATRSGSAAASRRRSTPGWGRAQGRIPHRDCP